MRVSAALIVSVILGTAGIAEASLHLPAVDVSLDLDWIWTPSAPNGSNITQFNCDCYTYMDPSTGTCLPSTIVDQYSNYQEDLQNNPLMNSCQFKRVILGQQVILGCPFPISDSAWTLLGRYNISDICVEEENSKCSSYHRIILTRNNILVFDPVLTTDPGIYECTLLNATNNDIIKIYRVGMIIDYDSALYGQLVYSSIIGAGAATAFLAIALSAHFIRVLFEYCRNQEMKEHVQWVVDFMSRHNNQHAGTLSGAHTGHPSNGHLTLYNGKIAEETAITPGSETSMPLPEIVIVNGKAQQQMPVRMIAPNGVRMEQVASIRARASQQMDRVRQRYYERAQRVRTQCSSQMDQLHQRYHDKLSKMKDYSSNRYLKIRGKYAKKRQDLQNYTNMKMTLVRDNYHLQRQYLSKVMDSLTIDSCRSYAPSFMGASEDYQASLRGAESFAGLDLDSLPIDDGVSSMASFRRYGLQPPLEEDDEDEDLNIDMDWECMTPHDHDGDPCSHGLQLEPVPLSPTGSPVPPTKGSKIASILLPCHPSRASIPSKVPAQLLRCPAFQAGICSDIRHNHVHGPSAKPVKKSLSSSPNSSKGKDEV